MSIVLEWFDESGWWICKQTQILVYYFLDMNIVFMSPWNQIALSSLLLLLLLLWIDASRMFLVHFWWISKWGRLRCARAAYVVMMRSSTAPAPAISILLVTIGLTFASISYGTGPRILMSWDFLTVDGLSVWRLFHSVHWVNYLQVVIV